MDKLLLEFLNKIDKDFVTPLSQNVALKEFSHKLTRLAINHLCVEDGEIAGVVSIYCNDSDSKIAYIPLVGVDKKYRGLGISKALMIAAIESARKRGFKAIGLHTESGIAMNLYLSLGFTLKDNVGRRYLELSL